MSRRKRRLLILMSCLMVAVLALVLRPRQRKMYTVTVLPSLGGDFVLPCAINERGQVAGFADVPKVPGARKTTYHLFLWQREKGMRDLGPVKNDRVAINNAGQIAATMEDPNGQERAFFWDPSQGRTVLPTLGGSTSRALAINDLGQVAGDADTAAGIRHAFVWDPAAGIRDLTPSGTGKSRAWSINSAGKTVLFGSGGQLLLDTDKGTASKARSIPVTGLIQINDTNDIAAATSTGSRRWDVVVWHEGSGARTLFQLKADRVDTPLMNDVGQIAVTWTDRIQFGLFERPLFPFTRASCLWDPQRGQIPLDRYLAAGWKEDFWLTDLNNQGCIVGSVYSTKGGRSRGILLELIPEHWGK